MVTTVAPRRKKPVLPEGVDQLTFFTSLTPVSPVLSPVKRQRHPRKPKAEGVQQLDIFSLISPVRRKRDPPNLKPGECPMYTHDKLTSLLLNQWQKHQPRMYRQFQQENRLQEELEKTAEIMSNRLRELIVIQKLPDNQAQEIIMAEMLHGEPEDEQEESM